MFSKTFSRGKIFEDSGFSFTCGRTKTEVFENNDVIYHLLLALRFHCLNVFYVRAKTIRIRYVWTRIFLKTEQKDLRFQKYPDMCKWGLCCGASTLICFKLTFQIYRAFSLTWSASMLIYWNKRKFLHKKRVQLPQDCWDTNMAAVSLFWNTNMAAVTSCENARLQQKNSLVWDTNRRQIRNGKESGLS